jgi:hypothetical protein
VPPKTNAPSAPSNQPPASRSTPKAPPLSPAESSAQAKPPVTAAAPPEPPASPTPAQPPAAAAAAPELPAAPTLDLDGLEQRLRDTHAIGVFTKLSLKNQVDDLLNQLRGFHEGHVNVPLTELRQRYEQLLLKVVTLLQDADEPLAKAVASSREAIWGILADPKSFAKI